VILLFNGAFNYSPNLHALRMITEQINPLLQKQKNFPYKILICGRDIPREVSEGNFPDISFAGFVDDISLFFKGADIFINPVTEGGGIKTKLVEALGYNMNAVSTDNGAIGIQKAWCCNKLMTCADNDWSGFVQQILKVSTIAADTPPVYYENFYWGFTAKKAAAFIESKS